MKSIKIPLLLLFFLCYSISELTAQNVVAHNKTEFLEDNSNDLNTIKVLKHPKVIKKKIPSQKKQIEKAVNKKVLVKVLKSRKRLRFRSKRNLKPGKCYKEDVCESKEVELDRNKIKRAH